MMHLDMRGKQCPIPVIETKQALEAAGPGNVAEVLVDNEIAVQNLRKLAERKGYRFEAKKEAEREYRARLIWESTDQVISGSEETEISAPEAQNPEAQQACSPDGRRKGLVAVLSSEAMGEGSEELGRLLMKGFIYALSQQEILPETVLLYNGGAKLSCEGAETLEDLKNLEALGVEILTCGTCLNYYGLTEKLAVGSVTNMYEIAERQMAASVIVKP